MEHGTLRGYLTHGCREACCRKANALYHRLHRSSEFDPALLSHGKRSTYVNKGCRCTDCKAANHAYRMAV